MRQVAGEIDPEFMSQLKISAGGAGGDIGNCYLARQVSALACLDGSIVPLAEAVVPATDDGLLRGDGVFEVMRLYDGVPFARERHLARMAGSAASIRLAIDTDLVREDIARLLEASGARDGQIRVLLTRGGRRLALLEPLPLVPETIALGCVTYAPSRVLDGVKSLSYGANMLAGRLARERGFDEALLVSPHGRVLECPTAAFFWVRGEELLTPPLSDHLLDSITRRLVIEVCGAREHPTALDELLAGASEAFLASSVREVTPVSRIEDRELARERPVSSRVAVDVAARIRAELDG
ncbi:MAG: aminodeoxychorismate lyase [Solirubrobacteraceae bacterium]